MLVQGAGRFSQGWRKREVTLVDTQLCYVLREDETLFLNAHTFPTVSGTEMPSSLPFTMYKPIRLTAAIAGRRGRLSPLPYHTRCPPQGLLALSTTKLKSSVLSQTQQVEDRQRRQERYNANIAGLSTESQTLLADMQHEAVDSTSAGADDVMGTMDDDFQWESVPDDLRDNDTFMLAVRDIVGGVYTKIAVDGGQRLVRLHANWAPIISALTFRVPQVEVFTISAFNASTIETPAEALVLSGYLGATPHSPTIAILCQHSSFTGVCACVNLHSALRRSPRYFGQHERRRG
ncbi:hypothetical protein DFJ58DRAFT_846714 [Suillus subalutaceus]|uniref:uncharacterized protein n=1 Tax=Suillus subalutaceus TaxID=48586 RepID=UPI001B87EB23|nr:uncharacterized protein DFJ58DRAFT_846714 [Suillus subalutaceus]KAG1836872.1 hypothetical protein DFJ58DRAFT_846714 [Suillus subalutaceus]